MKIFLLAPNYCWHTEDLLNLEKYTNKFKYKFLADTPPFLSRKLFKKFFSKLNLSYEFMQRVWRLIFCIPWSIYLRINLMNKNLIHCHGLFALLMAHLAGISNSRIIFTPQGSDLLVLPNKNAIIKSFLANKLFKLGCITADSKLILKKALELSPRLRKNQLKVIQNGIPLEEIAEINLKKSKSSKREIDICWIRGLSPIYQFNYFLKILRNLAQLSKYQLNISIISAYGNTVIPKEIYEYENLKIILLPRLNKDQFLNCLLNSKLVISIPESDSSPRSVYESIALGCKIFASNISCFD